MKINNQPQKPVYTFTEKVEVALSAERDPIGNSGDVSQDVTRIVPDDMVTLAQRIDSDGDFLLEDKEIKSFLKKQDILRDPSLYDVDEQKIMGDFKTVLQGKELPQKGAYHSYDQVIQEMKDLQAKYPDLVKMVSIGKTSEGRDIMAMKISKGVNTDDSGKPGFLITGTHHAREWMALESPFHIAKKLATEYGSDEKIKNRLDNSTVWVVPMVNPDGYEYSRTQYSFWRKNRQPIHKDQIPPQIAGNMKADDSGIVAYGVDLNRNYFDGNKDHFEYYRPPGDTPESTDDDFGGGWFPSVSDDPDQDTYRGPEGSSENETKSLLKFWLNNNNIHGIVNHHSYGRKIMYPFGVKEDSVANIEVYKEIGSRMSAAIGDEKYSVIQSSDLYTASGDPDDFAHLNGKLSFTIEIGNSFQPNASEIDPTNKRIYNANMAFLDWMIEHKGDLIKSEPKVENNNFNIPGNLEL